MKWKILRISLLCTLIGSTGKAQSVDQDYTHVIYQTGKIQYVNHHPACNPLSIAFDPLTLGGKGIKAPRIVFHLGYPVLNTGIDYTLRKLNTPDILRTTIVRFGLPLTPHLIQAYRGLKGGVYQLNFYDWWYDFNGKQPLNVRRDELITRAIIDIPLSCFARP